MVGTPEEVVVLGLPAGDHRVGDRDPRVAEEPRRPRDVEPTFVGEGAQPAAVLHVGRIGEEPHGLRLRGRAGGAGRPADLLELGDVVRVGLAGERVRRIRPVGGGRVGERAYLAELHVDGRRRRYGVDHPGGDRLEHAGPGRLLDVRDDVVEPVAHAQREHPRRGRCADGLAALLGAPGRDGRHERVVRALDGCRLRGHADDEDVPGGLRHGSVDRGAGGAETPVANGTKSPSIATTASYMAPCTIAARTVLLAGGRSVVGVAPAEIALSAIPLQWTTALSPVADDEVVDPSERATASTSAAARPIRRFISATPSWAHGLVAGCAPPVGVPKRVSARPPRGKLETSAL